MTEKPPATDRADPNAMPGGWPLSPAECMAVAAAVLEGVRSPGVTGGDAETPVCRLWRAFDGLPGIAVRIRDRVPDAVAGDRGRLLSWLRGEIRGRGAEADVLATAVDLAIEHVGLQERFLEAVGEARLEAMRELAYGAGHEINNPLANIATRAQSLLLDETDPERRRRLSTIVDQAFRARDMIGGLMVFARPPKPSPAVADIHAIVASVIDTMRATALSREVRLEYSPAPALRQACVDRVQVEEALRAVVTNAIEAGAPGSRIVIAVHSASGDATEITVVDDGRGLAPEQVRRAFDPFYSGREAGRGVGLGLPKAWRLLGMNGCRITLESRPGAGTRATIALPPNGMYGADAAAKSAQTSLLREQAPQR